MSGLKTVFDYLRNTTGVGVNGASYVITRLSDNSTIASGTTASDAVPATPLLGAFAGDETTIGYPGPILATVTDPTTGSVRVHTSRAVGIVGPWRSVDVTRAWRLASTGVVPSIGGELIVTTNGSNMVIAVSTGEYFCSVGDHGLIYAAPAGLTVTATAADASQPRIDTVALRFYPPGVAQEGRIDLVLLPGTPSSSPVAPGLTQNLATYWETPLADVRVDATVTTLAVGKATDRRAFCFLYPTAIAAGDTFYVDANGKFARLAKGTTGQALVQGATIPAWGSVANTAVTGLGTMSTQNAAAVAITGGTIAGTTLSNTDIETINVSNLTLQDNTDATKQAKFSAAGITTATTRTLSLPDATDTLVGKATTDTLTNKTLTAPAITDFGNAQHNHGSGSQAGSIAASAYPTMVGDTGTGGTKGAVPAPGAGDAAAVKFLKADGTWAIPAGTTPAGGDASTNTSTSVDSEVVLFSGTTGKLVKRGNGLTGILKAAAGVTTAVTAPSGAIVGTTDTQTLTNKTLTLPTIADLTNLQHDHSNAANGGTAVSVAHNPTLMQTLLYDGHTTGISVSSVSPSAPAALSGTPITLLNGVTYDVACFGAIEASAPSGDNIYVSVYIGGIYGSFVGEGTVGGQRTLMAVQTRTITGTGVTYAFGIGAKVGSGVGTLNSGSVMIIAVPRT